MSDCHVSNQIAVHCNEPEEVRCPECDGSMSYDKDYDLECDDIECGYVIILTADDF
jgi:hypothetical protein